MICSLCKDREADKANTHYLTDGIIRSCLNQDGSSEREKGFYFDLSSKSAFVEFNFQRETSIEILEESLGRQTTDEENHNAKKIPFSVDFVFCNQCENIFSEIENSFINTILPRFRNTNLNGVCQININKCKQVRLFFYLQIWRTHICDKTLNLSEVIAERLRQIILNYKTTTLEQLNNYPLSVTYLQTTGDIEEYTANLVGFTDDVNPCLIFINDFIIQFFESIESVRFFDFHGLNTEDKFHKFINYEEDTFVIPVFQNAERNQFLDAINADKAKSTLDFYLNSFETLWFSVFGNYPSVQITQEYLNDIIGDDFEVLKYSRERIIELMRSFILRK